MQTKTLGRLLKKGMGISSREEFLLTLVQLESQVQDPVALAALKNFFQDLIELVDSIDKSFADLDRTLFLRDSSLAISSREMTALNEEIRAQSAQQAAVLARLRETVHVLNQSGLSLKTLSQSTDDHDMQDLVEMVDFLVRTQIDSAQMQKSLYEEGLKICSVLSFRNLETQLRSGVQKLAGSSVRLEIYFSGGLFEGKDEIEFYRCNDQNIPQEDKRLSLIAENSSDAFLNIDSPKGNGTLAVIQLKFETGFKPEEIALTVSRISPLVPSVASTLENIKLLKEEKHKQHMESELDTIRLVQQTLLPPTMPIIKENELEMSGYYQSATECSGDWWTYFQLKDGRHAILVGDVTGHGTGSAMVCAVVKGYCDSFIDREQISAGSILSELNQVVYRLVKDSERAMTMSILIIDARAGQAIFANAGHPLPIVIRGEGAETVSRHILNSGAILGIEPEASYREISFDFQTGDRIVLYSDGLTECTNTQEEMYGEMRLRRLVRGLDAGLSASEMNRAILNDVQKFSMGEGFKDDLTTVVIRNLAPAPAPKVEALL